LGFLLLCCNISPQNSTLFERGQSLGTNKNKKLEEVSGLVASVANPGMLWAHNDSGHAAALFLLDDQANTVKVFKLENVKNRDWEDITLGAGPTPGVSYLYIGDIGDNYSRHKFKYIYRLPEPTPDQDEIINKVDTLVIVMPDGPVDTEALMADPVTHNLYLLSKREPQISLYEIPMTNSDTLQAVVVAKLPITQVVAANVSTDGNEVLVKNYDQVYYWKKEGQESLTQLLQKPAIKLNYDREAQGESIGWARDGSGFYTLSENSHGERGHLIFYKRK
jgi:hypothetical protein